MSFTLCWSPHRWTGTTRWSGWFDATEITLLSSSGAFATKKCATLGSRAGSLSFHVEALLRKTFSNTGIRLASLNARVLVCTSLEEGCSRPSVPPPSSAWQLAAPCILLTIALRMTSSHSRVAASFGESTRFWPVEMMKYTAAWRVYHHLVYQSHTLVSFDAISIVRVLHSNALTLNIIFCA